MDRLARKEDERMNDSKIYSVDVNLFIPATSKEEALQFAKEMLCGKETMTSNSRIFDVREL